LNNTAATFADKNAGTNKTVSISGIDIAGTDAGNYTLAATTATDTTVDITPKTLTATYVGDNKVYDGAVTASVEGSSTDIVAGDTVTFSNTTATFAKKDVGTNKTVSISGIDIAGTDAGNYTLAATTATNTTVDIFSKAITVSGLTADDKVYDATTAVTTDGSDVTFNGIIDGDNLTLASLSGMFSDKNTGTDKTVNLNSTYSGTDVGNYTFSDQATTTANIAPANLVISGITAANKEFDGNTIATVSTDTAVYSGLIAGDAVNVIATGVFSDTQAGDSKAVSLTNSYSGIDVGNYNITDQLVVFSDIFPVIVGVTPVTAIFDSGLFLATTIDSLLDVPIVTEENKNSNENISNIFKLERFSESNKVKRVEVDCDINRDKGCSTK